MMLWTAAPPAYVWWQSIMESILRWKHCMNERIFHVKGLAFWALALPLRVLGWFNRLEVVDLIYY